MANLIKLPCDEGVIRSAVHETACQSDDRAWVLAATILGSSLAMIDGTVVNVALPVIQAKLNATAAQVQWIVEAYALFLAALILLGGSLGDRYGRRRIFALGIAVFALASGACGLSQNVTQLIVARSIQGIGGALLVPGSLAIISASFSDEERGRAIGTWSGFTAITSAVGPVLGGWLVEYVSWRWIFWINFPLALIVLGILFWRVPESRDPSAAGLDTWGAMLATIGLGGLVYGLIEASSLGLTHPLVLTALVLGSVFLIVFVGVEAKSAKPMMPLSLFRSRTFRGANLLTLLLYAALGGVLFFVPFNLIQVQNYSPTAAGAAFLPLILLMFLLSRWSGGLVAHYGAKRPLVVGPLIAAVGFSWLAVPGIGGSYWTTFFPAIVVLGLGMAISVAPLTTTVMGAVNVQQAGIASGINNAVARTGGLMSIAVFSLILSETFLYRLNQRLMTLPIPSTVQQALAAQRTKLAGAELPAGLSDSVRTALEQAIGASFVDGFRVVMWIAASLAVASALIAASMIQSKKAV